MYRSYSGKYNYVHDDRGVTGRETFLSTVYDGGSRTLRSTSELYDIGLVRDVTYSVGGDWRPLDAFVRLTRQGRFVGSSWFRFTNSGIGCEALLASGGRISQFVEARTHPQIFAPHPVVLDGWQASAMRGAQPGETRRIVNSHCSPLSDGSSGPLAEVDDKEISFIGVAEVETRLGSFRTRHYRIDPLTPSLTPLDIWVTGEDNILIKLRWDLLSSTYELTEFEGELRADS